MKFMKVFITILLALFLTGCYTQLQYGQSMKKVTDKEKNDTPVYSWTGEEADSSKHKTNEEYIPIYYRDYEYATKYGDVYNFYGADWHRYPNLRYGYFYSWHDRWAYHSFYGRWYNRPFYRFSLGFRWGWSRYHYGYYDPVYAFYNPYYDYYWHRYYNRYAYGGSWNYYYGKSGTGHGYYPDKKVRKDSNVRYGPRSIGTNRVTDDNRSRTVQGDRSAVVRSRSSSSTVRTRSAGTSRTRGTSRGTSVNRSENNNGSSTGRSRTRGNERINDKTVSEYNYRSRDYDSDLPLVIDEDQLKEIRSRANRSNNQGLLNRSRNNGDSNEPTFLKRLQSFFDDNNSVFRNRDRNSSWGTRSNNFPTRKRSVNRSNRSKSSSSVTRSRSSSSNSRSRGSSSSSRSRSGGSSSDSGSERSRGN